MVKSLSQNDKLMIGQDIKTVQFAWPLGLPFKDLETARTRLKQIQG